MSFYSIGKAESKALQTSAGSTTQATSGVAKDSAKVSGDPNAGKYYYLLRSIQASIWVQDEPGKWHVSPDKVFLKEGQYFTVDRIGPDGSLYVKIDTNNSSYEVVKIPSVSEHKALWDVAKNEFMKEHPRLQQLFVHEVKTDNVKKMKPGEGTKIERYFRRLHENDAVVYFDSAPGNRVALTSAPESSNFNCSNSKKATATCTAFPSTADPMRVVDSTVAYTLDHFTGTYKPRLFYKVQTSYCEQGSLERCEGESFKDKTGWIEARRVGETKRDGIPDKVFNPYLPEYLQDPDRRRRKSECPDKLKRQLEGLSSGVAATEEEFKQNVYSQVGGCLEPAFVNKVQAVRDSLIKKSADQGGWSSAFSAQYQQQVKFLSASFFDNGYVPFDQSLRASWKQRQSGATLSKEQLFAIDAMARTIYGEMRSCSDMSINYYKAVARTLLNRAAIVKNRGLTEPFVKDNALVYKDAPMDKLLTRVVSSDRQYSSWNKDDVNLADNLCPLRGDPPNQEQEAAWRSAVQVAWEAVAHRNQFLEDTKGINYTHYYSPDAMPAGQTEPAWAVGKPKQILFQVGNETSGNKECLVFVGKMGYEKQIKKLNKDPQKNFSFNLEELNVISQ